jgi:hypothetical protein
VKLHEIDLLSKKINWIQSRICEQYIDQRLIHNTTAQHSVPTTHWDNAPDGWDCARFLGQFLSYGGFSFPSFFLPQPPVTQAVGRLRSLIVWLELNDNIWIANLGMKGECQ